MKKKLYTTVFLSTLIGSVLLLGSGCSQKSVLTPPSGSSSNQSGMYDGPAIPPAEAGGTSGYSENDLPLEGTLENLQETLGYLNETNALFSALPLSAVSCFHMLVSKQSI